VEFIEVAGVANVLEEKVTYATFPLQINVKVNGFVWRLIVNTPVISAHV